MSLFKQPRLAKLVSESQTNGGTSSQTIDRFCRKTLLCVWWNAEGVINYVIVLNNRTIDTDLYCTHLDRIYADLSWKYPAMVYRKRVLLQQDNTKAHTTRQTQVKIKETTRLNSYHTQHIVRRLRHPAITFLAQ